MYKIIRSARKSFSLSVSPENEIIVRCPQRASESRINHFVESKSAWLEKVLKKNEAKLSLNRSVLEYKEIYVCGEKLPLRFSDKNEITDSYVCAKSVKHIRQTYITRFWVEFRKSAQNLSELTGLKANGFFVKSYKRRWGCCNSKGEITFNFMLFMLPPCVQRYVIIHELCHTVHFNHSAGFWKLVSSFEPDYKILRNELKSFDFITNLY